MKIPHVHSTFLFHPFFFNGRKVRVEKRVGTSQVDPKLVSTDHPMLAIQSRSRGPCLAEIGAEEMVIRHSYNGYDSIWIQSFTEIQSLIKLKHWGRCWENNLVGGDWNHGIL